MATQSRNTLKGYFNTGDKPTESNFADLIDSFVSKLDDSDIQEIQTAVENKVDKAGDKMSGLLVLENTQLQVKNEKSGHNSIKSITDIQNNYNFPSNSNYLVLKHKLGVTNCFINITGDIVLHGNRGRVNFEIGLFYSSTAVSTRDLVFLKNSTEMDFLFHRAIDNQGNLLIIIKKVSTNTFGAYGNFSINGVTYSMQGSKSATWDNAWVLDSAIDLNELNITSDILDIPQDYRTSLKIKSPNGKIWNIKVDNNGQLTTSES